MHHCVSDLGHRPLTSDCNAAISALERNPGVLVARL
jgi:hypothetical protein